jgi:hypothetical protein
MKHFFAISLILLLALVTTEAEETGLNEPLEVVDTGQTELPQLLIHSNTFNALKFQFLDGTKVPPGQLTTILNIPQNEQLIRKGKNYTLTTRILNALTYVSAIGTVIYAGFDLPYSDTMLSISLGTLLGSTVSGIFTSQGAAINYLRAVDNYNLYIMGIPIGKAR